ncbi:pyrroline-5-carboxylate reductase dimerization domain-containing protein [Actinopolyspora sp. H202]|uniref:pyrroline-5-carboxylate reductase dimerization domain-containing protein n=1 Tax=Actinopolyspora sp. H202 TaxID=1500456 RepID=UPI003EE6A089
MIEPEHSRTNEYRITESVEDSSPATYGFVGTGEITAALVEGMHAGEAEPPAIFLSPRGRDVGRGLAQRFEDVHVCGSNQEVLDNATTIVLGVRPPVAHGVVTQLRFRPHHVVLSAVASVRLEQLHAWAAPAGRIVRAVPLPQSESGRGLTAMYPENALARELFGRVGGLLVPEHEAALEAISAATATFAAHLDHLTTIAGWLAEHGVDHESATTYTRHVFGQLGRSLLRDTESLAELADRHTTPGGINEQVMTELRNEGVPQVVRQALDRVLTRLRE